MASLSQGRTAAAQCGLFTHKSVPVIFEPPCKYELAFMYMFGKAHNQIPGIPILTASLYFPAVRVDLTDETSSSYILPNIPLPITQPSFV